jgi:hypothetical protein
MCETAIWWVLLQGYAARFVAEYVEKSGAAGDLNVGELWVDMCWEDGGVWQYSSTTIEAERSCWS